MQNFFEKEKNEQNLKKNFLYKFSIGLWHMERFSEE